jgi:hypothetical protein
LLHTEPSESGRAAFAARHPGARIEAGTASRFPESSEPFAGALCQCVLDIVDDLEAVVNAARVGLRPGARVVHFLDMTAELSGPFQTLCRGNVAVLPNVFADPSAREWPEDLLAVPIAQLEMMVQILGRQNHPFERPLKKYAALFKARPFNVVRAIAEYDALNKSPSERRQLLRVFQTVRESATHEQKERLAQYQGRPLSSARHLSALLKQAFHPAAGFEVECAEIVAAAERVPREMPEVAYRSLCVGNIRELAAVPAVQIRGTAARIVEPDPPSDLSLPQDEALVELGVFVFVARRLPDA